LKNPAVATPAFFDSRPMATPPSAAARHAESVGVSPGGVGVDGAVARVVGTSIGADSSGTIGSPASDDLSGMVAVSGAAGSLVVVGSAGR